MDQPSELRAAQFREFIQSWEDAYEFTCDHMWHARRRDTGAVVHAISPEELAEEVTQDYVAKPVRMIRP